MYATRATPLSSFLSGDVRHVNVCFALLDRILRTKVHIDLSDAIEAEIEAFPFFPDSDSRMFLFLSRGK